MIPDAEIISLVNTILTKLDVGEFTIKVHTPGNHIAELSNTILDQSQTDLGWPLRSLWGTRG